MQWVIIYLPRHENESQKNYAKRLQKAVLAPFFKRAVNFSTGKAFFKPITLQAADGKSELSDKIIELVNDAKQEGRFICEVLQSGVQRRVGEGIRLYLR